jgi:hypothetical protein
MHKIIFGTFCDGPWNHPGYLYLKSEARKEGWALTTGIKEMAREKWNARLYFRDGDIYGIGFRDAGQYNDFCVKAGLEVNLELF